MQTLQSDKSTLAPRCESAQVHRTGWFPTDNEVIDRFGAEVGPLGLAVYSVLKRFEDRNTHQCQALASTIAARAGMNRATVFPALERLKTVGLIGWRRTRGANVFTLQEVAHSDSKKLPTATSGLEKSSRATAEVAQNDFKKSHRATQNNTSLNKTTLEQKETSCAAASAAPESMSPSVASLPTNRKGELHLVSQADVAHLKELYPAVDVMQELRSMTGWLEGNPRNRKTAGGMSRFINAWLQKAQNSAPRAQVASKRGSLAEIDFAKDLGPENADGTYSFPRRGTCQ